MDNFYIKNITAYGSGKKPSSIDLSSGLNIICGPSNTGKSYVVECIDYMFGGSKKPFDDSTGYDRIKMIVEVPNGGSINLERQFGKTKTKVSSTVKGIESGDYGGKNTELKLSNLWLALIGIKDEHKIISNDRFVTQTLTWRTLLHMFLIKEDDILQKPSIIEDVRFAARTASLSALLFLMKGLDFNEFIPQEKPEIKEAKKAAVIKHINKELVRLSERKGELNDHMLTLGSVDVELAMQAIVDEIQVTENQIAQASRRSRKLLENIYEVSAKLEECSVLKDRYNALATQYASDIKRLSFIAEGEAQRVNIPENTKCPFCDSDLQEHEHPSLAKASQNELGRIMSQQKDLQEAQRDIEQESEALETQLFELRKENSGVSELISKELTPKINELRQSLKSYRTVIQIQNELSVIDRLAVDMNTELFQMETEEEGNQVKYKPKEHFDSETLETINKYLDDALTACSYENLVSVRLALDSFDLVVNGFRKDTFGKGYRAFFNTILAFVLMKYLAVNGKYAPKLLILDSPILSLKERSEQATDSMKSSLFRYLIANQNNGQVLVVENDIPDLDYSSANVIRFTMDAEKGRYGFLDGVHN